MAMKNLLNNKKIRLASDSTHLLWESQGENAPKKWAWAEERDQT
jgi:hypothetical protein